MNQSIYYALALIVVAVVAALLAAYLWRRRTAPGAWPLVFLLLAVTTWSAAYAVEITSADLASKLFWARVQYFGIVTIAPAWFVFAIQYTGRRSWFTRQPRNLSALAVIPVITLGMVWTNQAQGLIWSHTGLDASTAFPMLELDHGVGFWVFWAYSYLLLMLGSIWIASMALQSIRLYRWQASVALLGAIVPWIANLLYVTELTPSHLDLTPFAFFIAALAYAWSLFRFYLLDIVPVARRAVVDGLSDIVMVCDLQNRIVDANPATQKLSGERASDLIGQPAKRLLGPHADLVDQCSTEAPVQAEIEMTVENMPHYFSARITPLYGPRTQIIGRLVVLHDITDLKRAEAGLRQAKEELELIVTERTAALEEANRQLRDELARRLQAEHRFERFFETAPDAMIVVDQEGRILLANTQAETMFGCSRDELRKEQIDTLIPDRFRERHVGYREDYVSEPRVRPMGIGLDLWARRRDGSDFPAEISLSPLETEEGLLVVTAIRDISQRRRAQEALRESEARFRSIFRSSPVGMQIYDLERDGSLVLIEANPAADDILGAKHHRLIGKAIEDAFPEIAATDLPEQFRRVAASGETWGVDQLLYDGDEISGAFEVRAFQTSPGRVVAAFSDITERILAQEEQVRLLEEIGQQQEQLHELARQLSEAQEAERKELARELHDQVGRSLTALDFNLNLIRSLLPEDSSASSQIRSQVDSSLDLLAQTAEHVRDVMANLRPPVLDDYGLLAALEWYGGEFIATRGIEFSVSGEEPDLRLAPAVELALFRIAQEALTNVLKHAQASQVTASVDTDPERDTVRLIVADNGAGFEPSDQAGPRGKHHWGLITMAERARGVGGQCQLDSRPGHGTRVIVEVPR